MKTDVARHWQHPTVPGVDLMTARFLRHTFSRHSHESFAIGVIEAGAELLVIGSDRLVVTAGAVVIVNAETAHSGRAGHPQGWAYRVLYPPAELVAGVAAELGGTRGTPAFAASMIRDSTIAAAILAAHRAAEGADPLSASSLLHRALGLLWRAQGISAGPERRARPDHARLDLARDILLDRMLAPPTLDEVAAEVGLGRFALLRGFRESYGLPPHSYLNQQRVRLSQRLLAAGVPAAEVAARVGYSDQAHFTRHFRRTVGVPPGIWSRERAGLQ